MEEKSLGERERGREEVKGVEVKKRREDRGRGREERRGEQAANEDHAHPSQWIQKSQR